MKTVRRHHCHGLTLIEVFVSLLIVAVAVVGAMMYRYYSTSNARIADVHAGAGRVGLLVLEGWKGAAGRADYDPEANIGPNVLASSDISIAASGSDYLVQLTGGTNTSYYITLSYDDDVDGDGNIDSGLRKLIVEVTYYGKGTQDQTLSSKTVKVSDFVRI